MIPIATPRYFQPIASPRTRTLCVTGRPCVRTSAEPCQECRTAVVRYEVPGHHGSITWRTVRRPEFSAALRMNSVETDGVEAVIRRVRPGEGPMLRAVRLAALADSPSAFASNYGAEANQSDEQWEERAVQGAAGQSSATFFALIAASVEGLVGAYRPDPTGASVELVSMWVSPAHRRVGIAGALVDIAMDWALLTGATTVELWVTRDNAAAVRLYEAEGFRLTGQLQPLPSDPCKDEQRMRRTIG